MNPAREPIRIPIVFSEDDSDITTIVSRAMTAANAAQAEWCRTPIKRRLHMVRELRHLIAGNARQLAEASATARQRPALEALTAEVMPLAEACRFLERGAERVLGSRKLGPRGRPLWLGGVRSEIHRAPLGIVLVIGPGNYPLFLPGVQIIQALVAGNAVLFKPGVNGSAVARELFCLLTRAGFHPELVTVLPESIESARAAVQARPDKVIFTGSSGTGGEILAQLAPHLTPATMELSGNDAVIIRADADLDLVFKALAYGLTLNAGATCMAPKRVFIHRSQATELEGRLSERFGRGLVSAVSGLTPRGHVPLRRDFCANAHAAMPDAQGRNVILRRLISDALIRGAHFIAGEMRSDGMVISPIVLGGVSPESQLLREDVFAPVLSLVTVADDQEAVRHANDCPLGLTIGVFSRDEAAAKALASGLHAGTVLINDLIVPTADARLPFGGRKRSGFGVTRGAEGLLEMTAPKVVSVSRGKSHPAFEPAQPGDEQMIESYLRFTHGRALRMRWTALATLIRKALNRGKESAI